MITYASDNFISYHLNVDPLQNKYLSKRYNIRAIPTFIFVDEAGNEIDRIVGFMPPEEYLAEMKRIRDGINTYPDLVKRLAKEPDNADLIVNLARKVEVMQGLAEAIRYWEMLFVLDDVEPKFHSLASFKMALFHTEKNKDPATLISFIASENDMDILEEAHKALHQYYRQSGEKAAEAEAYRNYVDFMIDDGKETPDLLNGYAWRMTQIEMNLENALERVDQALSLQDANVSPRDKAQIMDTKGEVLWKLQRVEEAVAIMDECIRLQPEDSYYQEQKDKFLK